MAAIPSLNSTRELGELAKQKSKDGLNVLATLPTKSIEQGRYEEALQLENMGNEAIKGFEMPENLEDRFSEYHDIIIKRSAV